YRGPNRNPPWYLPENVDPVLAIYQLYDEIVARSLALPGAPRVMIATGLHQDPVEEPVFYWRLREHAHFLRSIGCGFEAVEPRLSRDFAVSCADEGPASRTEAV